MSYFVDVFVLHSYRKLTLQRYNIGTRLVKYFGIFFPLILVREDRFPKHKDEYIYGRSRFQFPANLLPSDGKWQMAVFLKRIKILEKIF